MQNGSKNQTHVPRLMYLRFC